MAEATYDVQHLALQAAGWISGTGASVTLFGCQMTRTATGTYAMLLDADNGVVDNESMIAATPKLNVRSSTITDTSNTVKTITVRDVDGNTADAGLEVVLWKTVTR